MRFTDLKPDFKPNGSPSSADRVIFLCPKCLHDSSRDSSIHVHSFRLRQYGHLEHEGGASWVFCGTGPSDFTLEAAPGSTPSVYLTTGCTAHFHITNGEVIPSEAPGGGKSW